jgi:hypothetical protein
MLYSEQSVALDDEQCHLLNIKVLFPCPSTITFLTRILLAHKEAWALKNSNTLSSLK